MIDRQGARPRWIDRLDERTGLPGALRRFLTGPMPPNVGWAHVLGSALLFLVAVQLATGACLLLYYAPTPDHAHESVRYLETQRFGALVRGVHAWSASLVVVLLLLHAARVFVHGAYRRPREGTWVTGVLLLFTLLAFAFTGYLLPWDQKAYWATVVGTEVMGTVPVVGPALLDYVRGGAGVGALTLSRFFAVHVFLLPAALVALVTLHLVQLRRHGPAAPPGWRPETGPSTPFYPSQVFRDTSFAFLLFLLLLVLAQAVPPALDEIADPGDTDFVPRPEWYFLFLFQLLKYFTGPFEFVGTLIIPAVAGGALLLYPFIERRRDGGGGRGRAALAGGTAAALAALTLLGWMDRAPPSTGGVSPPAIAGRFLARQHGCAGCHLLGGTAGEAAAVEGVDRESLSLLGRRPRRSEDWVWEHLQEPAAAVPGAGAEVPELIDEEREALLAFVAALARPGAPILLLSDLELRGGRGFFDNLCSECHTIHGGGGTEGPDLTDVATEHDRAWIREQILDPKEHKPDGKMPKYVGKISDAELETLLDYLSLMR